MFVVVYWKYRLNWHLKCLHEIPRKWNTWRIPKSFWTGSYYLSCWMQKWLCCSVVGWDESCRMYPAPRFLALVSPRPTGPSLPPGSVNWYHTYLERIKLWLIHQLASANHRIGQARIQNVSTIFRRSRIREASQLGIDWRHRLSCILMWGQLVLQSSGNNFIFLEKGKSLKRQNELKNFRMWQSSHSN